MTHASELTEYIARCRMAAIAVLLGTTIAVNAGAQQTTPGSAGSRARPCPVPQMSGTASGVTPAPSGVTTATANGETAATSTTAAATTTTAANGTPTGAGTTAGVAASPTPNNASTNPDQRLTGLNATNGANGVGADTTTTGKRVPPVAAQIPSDTTRTGATVCAPTSGHG